MENEIGISVGVKKGNTTNWYKAHSLTRHPKGCETVLKNLQKSRIIYKNQDFLNYAGEARVCP